MWIGLISMFVVIIPSVYSLIPLIVEQRKLKSFRKNRLTESIFTDRKEDLEDIIRILNIKEHCIQITGEEAQCGKTWMAKRLCDYINNQKDPEFRNMKLKCTYITADYLDMDNYTEKELDAYFKDNIVTNKTVLIFDHVDNFTVILGKQRQFHFQMIYILKNNVTQTLTTHSIIMNTKFIQNNRYRSMSSLFWCGNKYRISIIQEGHCTYGKTIDSCYCIGISVFCMEQYLTFPF